MADDPKIITKPQVGLALFMCLAGAAMVALGLVNLHFAFEGDYPSLLIVIIGLLCVAFGVLSISTIFWYLKVYRVFADRLETRSIFGYGNKITWLHDINGWSEKHISGRYGAYDQLTVYTNNTEFTISSQYNKFYDPLKQALIFDKPQIEAKVKWYGIWGRLFLVIVLSAMGVIALWAIWGFGPNLPVAENQFASIEGVITNQPSIYRGTISVYLKEYPKFEFVATNNAFAGMAVNDFVNDIKPGDTVSLSIDKIEYKKKITKELPLKFADKYGSYASIHCYGLNGPRYAYLNLTHYIDIENYENAHPDKSGSWILVVAALFCFSGSLYLMKKEVLPLYRKYKEQHS